jgi:uncharacterized membrane protein
MDPKRASYKRFRGTYDAALVAIVAFLIALHVAALGVALGWPIRLERLVLPGAGLLLIVIGNILPRARQNWFFGIRTPWTLSSERVWERTHRVGGYLMIVLGAMLVVAGFMSEGWAKLVIVVAAPVILTLGTFGYSYFLWRHERDRPRGNNA